MVERILSHSEEETIKLGETLSKSLRPGDIVCLFGNLGSGKTTFVKGVAKGLKIDPDKVNSPTFVLLNIYDGTPPLYHFDLYRIEQDSDIAAIGCEEFMYGDGVSIIEWAEHLKENTPKNYLSVRLTHKHNDDRQITLSGKGQRYQELIKAL